MAISTSCSSPSTTLVGLAADLAGNQASNHCLKSLLQALRASSRSFIFAGTDGIGLFHLCSSLLTNLGKLAQGQALTPRSPYPFRDVFAKLEAWLPMGISKQPKPTVPDKYMPTLPADRMLEDVEPHVAAVWSELDENWTQALLSR